MDDQSLLQLSLAVDAVLNPSTAPADRLAAHNICEEAKNNQMCGTIGFALVCKQDASDQIRHFGLQMMRGYVQHKWTKISQEMQLQAKNNAVELITNCGAHEIFYIKDGIAHVLAEIVKHVWPQQWPSMVPDLLDIASKGATQIELVELVLLRVAEDVAVLQNISVGHRSQDIRHALSVSMKQLLSFFMGVLENSWNKCAALHGSTNEAERAEFNVNFGLCKTTLTTCQGFLEWANTEHVFANDGAYIDIFCALLKVEGLKVLSAECLILLVHRKGQPADRERILNLTTTKCVDVMVQAIEKAVSMPADSDHQYLFMKRVGELVACLATQIMAAWVADTEGVTEGFISNLKDRTAFLTLMMNFLRLDNPVLSECVTSSWYHMLQHRGYSKDKTLHSYVFGLLQTSASRLEKCSKTSLPTCTQLDFNDDVEIKLFLNTYKRNLLQIVRGCAVALPIDCMGEIIGWVKQELDRCVSVKQEPGIRTNADQGGTDSVFSSARWDSLKSIIEMTIKTGLVYSEKLEKLQDAPFRLGAQVFQELLNFDTSESVSVSQSILGVIGGFLPLFEHVSDGRNELMVATVRKIMQMLRQAVRHRENKGSPVGILRRHCLSSVIHLCKYYPSFLFPIYETFKHELTGVLTIVGDLDKVSIFEAVILVSGEQKNFSAQSRLVVEALNAAGNKLLPVTDYRMGSPEAFANAIGLFSSADKFMMEETDQFRKNISFCVAIIMAVINRSRVPDNQEDLRNGGFYDSEGNVMNPCGNHVLTLMEYVVTLVENFHGLWAERVRARVHHDFQKSLDIRDCEKKSMITANPVIKESDESDERLPWQRMQTFILVVLENCYQILGGVGKCCSTQLYDNPDLFPVFLEKAFSNFSMLSDLRIRSFTRQFLYQFLKSCPEELSERVIAPVLKKYCSLMNSDLKNRWNGYEIKESARLQVFKSYNGDIEDFEDSKEEDEILQEQLLRTVSRVYLDLLVNLCINKNPKPKNNTEVEVANNTGDADMQDDSAPGQPTASSYQLTTLGSSLVQTDAAETVLGTALLSLTWHDTTSAFKGVQLTWPLLKIMFSFPSVQEDAARFIFESTLVGLRRHGQHDGCSAQLIALSCFIYVNLRPAYQSMYAILQSIPGINGNALKIFDQNYMKYAEKKRKTNFRKLVSNTIEQHISQRFKNRQEMKKLPRFFLRKAKPECAEDEDCKSLASLFKPEST